MKMGWSEIAIATRNAIANMNAQDDSDAVELARGIFKLMADSEIKNIGRLMALITVARMIGDEMGRRPMPNFTVSADDAAHAIGHVVHDALAVAMPEEDATCGSLH